MTNQDIEYKEQYCKYSLQFSSLELDDYNSQTIDKLLLSRIKEKFMGKCTIDGYISDVHKIVGKDLPIITNKDLSADVTFSNINTRVTIANYNIGDIIKCTIDKLDMNIGSYISMNKPFIIFLIASDNIRTIKIGEQVNLKIVAKKIDQQEIHLIGELFD